MNTQDRNSESRRPIVRAGSLRRRFALRPLVVALAGASLLSLPGIVLSPARAQAVLPSGLNVVAGQAQAVVNGQQMTVTNSANSILNWQSFSIGNNNGVHFAQPDAASQVLNRVVGNDPSAILGSLSSNGRIWLLNPNGVLFGHNARVDVGGLVTSTLRLNDVDWLNGRYNFAAAAGDASTGIVNQGELRSSLGGRIALLGGSVRNEGLIEAPNGQVMLAAGQSIDLVDTGSPNLKLRVTAPDGEAMNLGTLAAAGGRIDVHGAVVNQQGIVRADGFATNAAGEIEIRASQELNLAAGSVTSASGAGGGSVQLDAGAAGTAMIRGDVLATGSGGNGGDVKLLGRQVGLADSARVDASGSAGGGQVLVGGGLQGKDPSVRNAEAVFVGRDASINVDATHSGDGGRIILWSDVATRAYGSFSARGGNAGGNGGFIETSGGWIDVRPTRIDATASAGLAGTWLLDPYDILIDNEGATNVPRTPAPPPPFPPPPDPVTFTASDNGSRIRDLDIASALNNGNSVVVSTGANGAENGDITVRNATIDVVPRNAVSFSLNAARDIVIDRNSSITSTGPGLSVNLTAAGSGEGTVRIDGSTILTNGGNLVARGIGFNDGDNGPARSYGIYVRSSTIAAGTGNITLTGESSDATSNRATGVRLDNVDISGRDLVVRGNASSGPEAAWGVLIQGGTVTASHSLDIRGDASQIGVAAYDTALRVAPPAVDLSASFTIIGSSASTNHGIDIAGQYGGSLTASNGASMALTGSHAGGEQASLSLRDGVSIGDASSGAMSMTANSPAVIDATIISGGPYTLLADDVTIALGASITSQATGDAIIIAGKSGPNTISFFNANAGCCALIAPNGRWLVYGQNTGAVTPGGLDFDFKQYNASFGTPNPLTPATGNGLLYFDAPIVTVTGNSLQKTYDGTTTISLAGGGLIINGQRDLDVPTVDAGATGDFDNKNVGTNKPITIAPAAVTFRDTTGKPVLGYGLNSLVVGDILRKLITLAGVVAQNKVYDGNTVAIVTVTGLNGLVDGETLNTNATGSFDNKNVGSGKTVTATATLADGNGGGLAGNYQLDPNTAITTADITRRQLGGIVTAANKVYDGNTTADVMLSGLVNLVGSETLVITPSGNFDSKDAGNAKPVAVVFTIADGGGGGLASNYLAPAAGTPRADITPAPLTVTANNASKTFGTTLVFDGTEFTTSALQAGETVGRVDLTSTGAVNTASVAGGPYPIVASNASGGTFDARNYDIRYVNGILVVNPADLRAVLVNIVGNPTKTYDGTDAATLASGNYALNGFIGSDDATVVQTNGRYDSPNAGNRTVTVVLTGASFVPVGTTDLNNYSLPALASGPGTIVPKPLTLAGVSADNKIYDGSVAATLSNLGSLVGLVGGQTLVVTNSGARFDTKDAGTAKTVTVDGLSLANGSGLASNYLIASSTTTTADIDRRQLGGSFSAADKVYDGNTAAVVTLTGLTNLVGSETLNGTASGNFNNRNVGNNKPVTAVVVLANGGSGGLASNYLAPTGSTAAAITPATLTYTANPANKLIEAPLPPLSGTVGGFVTGDDQSNATTGNLTFTTPATASSPIGRYAINGGGLTAQNYNFVQAASNATALSVTGVNRREVDDNGSKVALNRSLAAVAPPRIFSSPAEGRVFDVIQTLRGQYLGQGALFRAIPVEQMSQDSLTTLLAARDQYKKALFAEAIRALERDPTLADVPACTTVQEVDNGTCLITEDLKRQLRIRRDALRVTAATAPAPAPAPATAAPAPATPVVPAPAAPVDIPAAEPREAVGIAPAQSPLFTRRVRTASLPQIQRKIAVVIGNNRYTDRRMPQLENAVGDARAIGQLLGDKLGYETVVLENANKQDVVRTLNRLAVELDPTDSVIVYYAGHGELIKETGIGYWQLSDSNPTRPETWMSNDDISRLIGRISADQVALISDSCYSGTLVDERIRARAGTLDPQQVLAKKTVVVMSSGGNEPVFDEGKNGHSPFAYNLMRNLEQVANWQAGGNLFERVRFAVARELPQRPLYGSASAAGHQPGGDYLFEQRQLDSQR